MTTTDRWPAPLPVHADPGRAALPSDVLLTYLPPGGRQVAVRLDEAGDVPFEAAEPARRIPGYRGQRNLPGWWWSSSTGRHVVYESWLERHHLMALDRQPSVVGISGQPFAVSWSAGLLRERHIPDFFVRFADGGGAVVDCRPVRRADDHFRRVAAISATIFAEPGWSYRLAGEPDPVEAANLRWLAGYRRAYVRNEQVAAAVLQGCVGPVSLIDVAASAGDPVAVLPTVFHLLWAGELCCDLTQPLSDHSLVRRVHA